MSSRFMMMSLETLLDELYVCFCIWVACVFSVFYFICIDKKSRLSAAFLYS